MGEGFSEYTSRYGEPEQLITCQHDYKEVGSGFLMTQWQCSKCGDQTDDYGVSNP
jgi:hypothetical protein